MSEAAPNTTFIQPIPMIKQDDPYTVGTFMKGLFALVIVMAVGGELAYDGDFTSTHAGPQQVMRSCVQTFRHHPLAMSLESDISTAAMPFEGLSAAAVAELLDKNHFKVVDDTRRYADKMVYNDRALRATRSASRFWPEIFRKDSCEVTLFMKDGVISGATAVAVRESRIPMPRLNFNGIPSFSGLQSAVTSSVNY